MKNRYALRGGNMNIAYQIVQFFYLLSLSLWIGGTLVFGALSAPVIFKKEESRAKAGEIAGEILRRLDIVKGVCLAVLVVTAGIKAGLWEQEAPFFVQAFKFLALFGIAASYVLSLTVSIKIRTLKDAVKNFDETPENDPNRAAFNAWHKQSVRLASVQLACALAALFLS